MSGVGPLSQDWEPVVLRKKAPTAAAKKDEKAVNAARRSGADIETVKKFNAGTNKAASSSTSFNTKRLDDDTESLARYIILFFYLSLLLYEMLNYPEPQDHIFKVLITIFSCPYEHCLNLMASCFLSSYWLYIF
ncbi:multiprotein-bridging factor 1b isoform X2 [Lotus japonicus]|uniref:multiprotein-bridging factor 1b isoform X2 n=1 Tax=Lotus japonicus TaxID=34305 RepID=UPI00258F19E7|nr:multiprotein-bridging factor 1b isoform X2 [Lotus japonicus]